MRRSVAFLAAAGAAIVGIVAFNDSDRRPDDGKARPFAADQAPAAANAPADPPADPPADASAEVASGAAPASRDADSAVAFDAASLRRKVGGYLAHRPGRAGLMVFDTKTGASFGWGERSTFVTASIMKVDILTGLLLQRQRAHDGLSSGERALAARMIRYSDNSAADALYAKAGRGAGISRTNRLLGLRQTVPYPTRWGASSTSPADQVRLLRKIATGDGPLNAANRHYILGLMGSVSAGQDWGVPAAARPGDRVAVKNGWVQLHYQGTGWAVNTIGRVTGHGHDFLVAVCSVGHPSMETGVATVEHLASMVVGGLRRLPA
ncbi:serine hydrolase [Actinomadura barringtoniae]|uniref:Serine hydrolase n=1 Tax=Actinomadura barringtoniae TaxID=1427535 RepID=A0A939PL95_9ACTN|nr:serine hydrolase [Actinomadura barringtoniae]MBO2452133.1 serine hydrolase [Actinomadura barringtoniae]